MSIIGHRVSEILAKNKLLTSVTPSDPEGELEPCVVGTTRTLPAFTVTPVIPW